MYAIINKGDGQYYTSTVFAYYEDNNNDDGEIDCWDWYYIVLNESRTALVKHYVFDATANPYLHKMVIVTDRDKSNWNVDGETGIGEINLVKKNDLLKMVEQGTVSDELLAIDEIYKFNEYPEIQDFKDIDNLMTVSGYFHDAYIDHYEEKDGTLYVLFDGIWGGKVEVWFSGDVKYDVSRGNLDERYDPTWYGATMLIENGFIYLVNGDNVTAEKIGDDYCWFKARKVKYHVIPNLEHTGVRGEAQVL
ncbi:hypothetical protein SAMN05216366_11646 [Selenomonas ruminantium]|uniref:Uncharacterized protein n=2 Tax=Selenomonas ruminantium TaxID=971 RepID=A0A1H0SAL0_SELRU|nr:hypothetical protein SAMN05216366_11646 [Selenomonas ruminantium]